MKVTFTRDTVLEALQKVQNVVGSRTTLPILLNTLVEAGEDVGGLRFTATDMDLSVRASVQADVARDGQATLPAKRLFSILRELPSGEVSFEVNDQRAATIQTAQSRFVLMGMPPEEFPAFPDPVDGVEIVMPQSELSNMLRRTSYAASTDETRQALNGILFKLAEARLTLVATDGRRLALAHANVPEAGESVFETIVPTKAVREIERLLSPKGQVRLVMAATQAHFAFRDDGAAADRSVLVTRLIDGSFPNYEQVIPSESRFKVVMNRESLLEAMRRVSLLASEKSSSVRLHFRKKSLTVSANTPDVGEAEETIEVEFPGDSVEIGFNPGYLMDPLKNLDSDKVTLELTDELSPGVLRSSEPFLYVLMPMRLS